MLRDLHPGHNPSNVSTSGSEICVQYASESASLSTIEMFSAKYWKNPKLEIQDKIECLKIDGFEKSHEACHPSPSRTVVRGQEWGPWHFDIP